VTDDAARRLSFDAAIVSNLSPVHAASRASAWAALTDRPVIDLFARDAAGMHGDASPPLSLAA